jgi:peptidoglycan hydrolase-like protein with peptidoglycan-binding domain
VFRYAGEALKLTRCELDSKGAARLRSAPVVSNRLVTLLQRSLQDLGFDPGKVDGLIGPRTRAAVRRLQESEGTRATGRITFDLLDRVQQRLTARTATDEPR